MPPGTEDGQMMGYGHGLWGMGGSFGALLGLTIWLGVIGLLIWGLRALLEPREQGVGDDALTLVAGRFASGEISQAEFELARRALTTDRATSKEQERSKTMRKRTKVLVAAGLLATTLVLATVGGHPGPDDADGARRHARHLPAGCRA
jgi:uncharacterized membrane protein